MKLPLGRTALYGSAALLGGAGASLYFRDKGYHVKDLKTAGGTYRVVGRRGDVRNFVKGLKSSTLSKKIQAVRKYGPKTMTIPMKKTSAADIRNLIKRSSHTQNYVFNHQRPHSVTSSALGGANSRIIKQASVYGRVAINSNHIANTALGARVPLEMYKEAGLWGSMFGALKNSKFLGKLIGGASKKLKALSPASMKMNRAVKGVGKEAPVPTRMKMPKSVAKPRHSNQAVPAQAPQKMNYNRAAQQKPTAPAPAANNLKVTSGDLPTQINKRTPAPAPAANNLKVTSNDIPFQLSKTKNPNVNTGAAPTADTAASTASATSKGSASSEEFKVPWGKLTALGTLGGGVYLGGKALSVIGDAAKQPVMPYQPGAYRRFSG